MLLSYCLSLAARRQFTLSVQVDQKQVHEQQGLSWASSSHHRKQLVALYTSFDESNSSGRTVGYRLGTEPRVVSKLIVHENLSCLPRLPTWQHRLRCLPPFEDNVPFVIYGPNYISTVSAQTPASSMTWTLTLPCHRSLRLRLLCHNLLLHHWFQTPEHEFCPLQELFSAFMLWIISSAKTDHGAVVSEMEVICTRKSCFRVCLKQRSTMKRELSQQDLQQQWQACVDEGTLPRLGIYAWLLSRPELNRCALSKHKLAPGFEREEEKETWLVVHSFLPL